MPDATKNERLDKAEADLEAIKAKLKALGDDKLSDELAAEVRVKVVTHRLAPSGARAGSRRSLGGSVASSAASPQKGAPATGGRS